MDRESLLKRATKLNDRLAAGPRPPNIKKWEDGAEKVEKGLAQLYGLVATIQNDGDMTDDEVREVSKLIGQAQKALDKAISKMNQL